jgi:hypothetical protein
MSKKNEDSDSGPCRVSRDGPPVLSQKLVGVPPATHTPGPWNVMMARTLNHVETDASAPVAGVAICSLPKKQIADALLIAAAPDLLAACDLARAALRAYTFKDGDGSAQRKRPTALDALDAAIAKVKP